MLTLQNNSTQKVETKKEKWQKLPFGTLILITGGQNGYGFVNKCCIGHVVMKMEKPFDKIKKEYYGLGEHLYLEGEFIFSVFNLTDNSHWIDDCEFTDEGCFEWEVLPNGTTLTVQQPTK